MKTKNETKGAAEPKEKIAEQHSQKKEQVSEQPGQKSSTEKKEGSQDKKNELQELTELLQRTQANFENYRKQMDSRMAEMAKMAGIQMIQQILPIIDGFELALKNNSGDSNGSQHQNKSWEGIQLIYTQLKALLENNGVKEIETKGQMFDPYLHEALLKEASDLPENTIMEEYQKGYLLYSRVLRHARVKISAGKTLKEEKK